MKPSPCKTQGGRRPPKYVNYACLQALLEWIGRNSRRMGWSRRLPKRVVNRGRALMATDLSTARPVAPAIGEVIVRDQTPLGGLPRASGTAMFRLPTRRWTMIGHLRPERARFSSPKSCALVGVERE